MNGVERVRGKDGCEGAYSTLNFKYLYNIGFG